MSDSARPTLIQRLKKARMVQVLLVYLTASWVVLQLVDTLVGLLALPDWVGPVAVVLLAIGFVVVTATAWVQSLPATTAAEQAGEVPTDWEVAPGEVLESLLKGELPHLTWARALMGGVLALSSLFGAAGLYVLVAGGPGLLGPARVEADATPVAVAVLPFQTRGVDLDVYGEGMVDLLTSNLEGLGGLRTVNAGSVVARWHAEVGRTTDAELDAALRVAGGLNARYAVRGSVIGAGDRVRLVAEIFDLADGSRVDDARAEGSADAMLEVVDELTVRLARAFVGRSGRASSQAGLGGTRSLAALEPYLRGESLYRQARFGESVEAFREATRADSTFALAWWRLSEALGWSTPGVQEAFDALRRAEELGDRLPARERLLLRADAALAQGERTAVENLRAHLRADPLDAEAWALLSEYAVHAPQLSMSPPGELREAGERAIELMPSFEPFYVHPVGLALIERREADFLRLLGRLEQVNPDNPNLTPFRQAWAFLWGTPQERAEAQAFFDRASLNDRLIGASAVGLGDTGTRVLDMVNWVPVDQMPDVPIAFQALEPGVGLAPGSRPGSRPDLTGHLYWGLLVEDAAPPAALRRRLDGEPSVGEAVTAAVLGAKAGDVALVERALAALETARPWPGAYGLWPGAATVAEARRTAEAVQRLRDGDAAGARDLLLETLRQPAYDGLSVLLLGDAHAALEEWPEALRSWGVLLRGPFRAHVRLRMGRAHQALGDTAAALESYRGFLAMWADADPNLAPKAEAVRAVASLGG